MEYGSKQECCPHVLFRSGRGPIALFLHCKIGPAVDKPVAEDQAVEVEQEGVSTEGLSGSPLQLGLQELQILHAYIKPRSTANSYTSIV